MILCPHQGLCNRLENVFSHLGETRARGETLTLIWQDNAECSGNFYDFFLPIEGLEIVDIPVPENHKQIWTPMTPSFYELMGRELKPTEMVLSKTKEWTDLMGEFIAAHVRHTDFIYWADYAFKIDIKSNRHFFAFIDEHEPDTKIFLASDNAADQGGFRRRYGERVFFNPITPSQDRRKTTLQEAVIDLFVCVAAKDFLGTRCSSFSKTILTLRNEIDKIFTPYYNPPHVKSEKNQA